MKKPAHPLWSVALSFTLVLAPAPAMAIAGEAPEPPAAAESTQGEEGREEPGAKTEGNAAGKGGAETSRGALLAATPASATPSLDGFDANGNPTADQYAQATHGNLVLVVRFAGDTDGDAGTGFNAAYGGSWYATNWQRLITDEHNNADPGAQNYPSLRSYLKRISGGKVDVVSSFPQTTGSVNMVPITLDNSEQWYLANGGDTTVVREAVEKAASLPYVRAALDRNGDGVLDNLTVIGHTLTDGVSGTPLFNHQSSYPDPNLKVGSTGLTVGTFTMLYYKDPTSYAIETEAHEFMHVLGAPDLYHTTGDNSNPVSFWDCMGRATFSWPLAQTRADLGWIGQPKTVDASGTYTLSGPESGKTQAVAVKSPLSTSEYFVIEYRKKGQYTSFSDLDRRLSNGSDALSGVIVYRVDTAVEYRSNSTGNDYIYVFRPGADNDQNNIWKAAVGLPQYGAARSEVGSLDMAATLADDAITLKDGSNSGIKVSVTQQTGDSATVQVELADFSGKSFWESTTAGADFNGGSYHSIDLATDGSALYALTTSGSYPSLTAQLWKYQNGSWAKEGPAAPKVAEAKLACCGGSVYLSATTDTWESTLMRLDGNSWTTIATSSTWVNAIKAVGSDLYWTAGTVYKVKGDGATVVGSGLPSISGASDTFQLGDTLGVAVANTSGRNWSTKIYVLSNGAWAEAATPVDTAASSISSATVGDTTYLCTMASGKPATIHKIAADGSIAAETSLGLPATSISSASLFSDGPRLYVSAIQDGKQTAAVYSVDTENGFAATQVGENIATDCLGAKALAAGGSIYCATCSSTGGAGVFAQKTSHPAAPVEPEPTPEPESTVTGNLELAVDYPSVIKCGEPVTFTMIPGNGSGELGTTVEYNGDPNKPRYLFYVKSLRVKSGNTYELENDPTRKIKDEGTPQNNAYTEDNTFTYTFVASGDYQLTLETLDFGGPTLRPATRRVMLHVEDPAAPTVETVATNLASACKEQGFKTDFEKALWVHDQIMDRATYDHAESYMGPSGVLIRGKGTCESYHRAYAMVLDQLGIKTERAEGNGHVWTRALLDGAWCHIDLTWDDDDTLSGDHQYMRHMYFGLTDEQIALVHSAWAGEHKPDGVDVTCDSTNNNYFLHSGEISRWVDPLAKQIAEKIKGSSEKELKFSLDGEGSPYPNACKLVYPMVAKALNEKDWGGDKVEVSFSSNKEKVDVRVIKQKILPGPSTLQVTAAFPSGVRISWDKVDGADGYAIMRADGASGSSFKQIHTTSTGSLDYYDTSTTPSTTYSYSVRPYTKGEVVNFYGNWVARQVVRTAPPATQITAADTSANGVNLYWSEVPTADGYVIMRSDDTSSSPFVKIASLPSHQVVSYRDKTADNGKRYSYSVIPYVKNMDIYTRGPWSVRFSIRTVPSAPTINAIETYGKKVRLEWTPTAGSDGYVIMRKKTTDTSYVKIASTSSKQHVFIDNTAEAGKTYSYSIIGFVKNDSIYSRGAWAIHKDIAIGK